ncbi:unnamed protein product [Calypogeia fissa]
MTKGLPGVPGLEKWQKKDADKFGFRAFLKACDLSVLVGPTNGNETVIILARLLRRHRQKDRKEEEDTERTGYCSTTISRGGGGVGCRVWGGQGGERIMLEGKALAFEKARRAAGGGGGSAEGETSRRWGSTRRERDGEASWRSEEDRASAAGCVC